MEFRPVNELTYNEEISELETLLRTIQNENCDIDKLTSYTRRATELLTDCRKRLTATDEELKTILSSFSN